MPMFESELAGARAFDASLPRESDNWTSDNSRKHGVTKKYALSSDGEEKRRIVQ